MKKFLQSEFLNNLKIKSKNYGFWVSIISSIIVFLQAIGIEIADKMASDIIGAVCSVLVVMGIISNPTVGHGYVDKPSKSDKTKLNKQVLTENINQSGLKLKVNEAQNDIIKSTSKIIEETMSELDNNSKEDTNISTEKFNNITNKIDG